MAEYKTFSEGELGTFDYRVYFQEDGKPISPFHDIPVWVNKKNKIANMVVEIPKGTQYKLEINVKGFLNPIKHDIKKGKIRLVAYPYPAHYGALPQTWENPNVIHKLTGAKGDNDPIDIFDISSIPGKTGQVKQVKVLSVFAMIDEGETDWKIIAIDINDPLASKLENTDDIEKEMPGKLKELFTFLRDYKIPDGKPPNKFAFNGKAMSEELATEVIQEGYDEWRRLMDGKEDSSDMALVNNL